MKRSLIFMGLLLAVLSSSSCNDQYANQQLADELKTSPALFNLNGTDYYIYADLVVDHSHPSEVFGVHTSCCITIVTADSTPVDPGITFINKYVIKDNMVWTSAPGEVDTYPYSKTIQSHDGPNWGSGYFAEVVLEFLYQGQKYRLLSTKEYVDKIE